MQGSQGGRAEMRWPREPLSLRGRAGSNPAPGAPLSSLSACSFTSLASFAWPGCGRGIPWDCGSQDPGSNPGSGPARRNANGECCAFSDLAFHFYFTAVSLNACRVRDRDRLAFVVKSSSNYASSWDSDACETLAGTLPYLNFRACVQSSLAARRMSFS